MGTLQLALPGGPEQVQNYKNKSRKLGYPLHAFNVEHTRHALD